MSYIPIIDVSYDLRTDAMGRDPDKFSATLRKYHKILWSKPLPNGVLFDLDDTSANTYLHHKSVLGEFFLASDAVIPTFERWKRLSSIIEQIQPEIVEDFIRVSYTIGGMMIFPGNRINGKVTINGERGFNRKIADRFDLTLECIRRFYLGEVSPMSDALKRYQSFFTLFGDFRGYVDFFLLNDLVSNDYSRVEFFMPLNDFYPVPVPHDLEKYVAYRQATIKFVNARNQRIALANT